MKSIHPSCHLIRRLALLLCAGLFVLALPASAKDKQRGSSHHYNPHYNGHSNGRANGHSNSRSNHSNFKQYNPRHGYYQGYYNDYPVYAPQYRGRSYYGGSNYGRNQHNSLLNQLLRRL
ncbi:hypothetical protein [Prosthecobacter sp.]|uniref:hypothetical protein n=1 Tax=Prosthecobacter sp. TaxID=1965333 RepID=UPI002ABCAF52|nr:hypothetical protein [Prosthecobacter sp.]MDZ4405562.1 hypothetical protein [Prosthecobacter sp.]